MENVYGIFNAVSDELVPVHRYCTRTLFLESECQYQRYLTLIDCGLVYTATFQPMGEILRLQRQSHIAEIPVACRETSIHYDINGLQVKEFLLM
jgi:hypothetical protein